MPDRILPPYPTLRAMVAQQGLSYSVIAKRYGVGYDSVFQSLKNDALKAGDPWPIERDISLVVKRGINEAMIDATWVRESLIEAYEEAQETFMPSMVQVSPGQVDRSFSDSTSRVRYHRAGCVYIKENFVEYPYQQAAETERWIPCGTCCRKLSLHAWSRQIGIEQSHLSMVMGKKLTRVKKSTAVKMMRAIGEEPHPTLANWQPTWSKQAKRIKGSTS